MTTSDPTVAVTIDVRATADEVYALLVDLDALSTLAEETESMAWTSGSEATPGAVFRGRNRNGVRRWSTRCTVTDAEPGRRFAFEVTSGPVPVARWQYDVEPLGTADGTARCRVTESTWDRRPGWFVTPAGWLTGVPDRATASRRHIEATLERLRVHAETAA